MAGGGIRIPGADQIESIAPARDPGVQASPDEFGAQVGVSAQHFGDALDTLGAHLYQKRKAAEDQVYEQTHYISAAPAIAQAELEARKAYPDGGPGFMQDLNSRLVQANEGVTKGLADRGITGSDAAQARVATRFAGLQGNALVSGVTYDNNAQVKKLQDATDSNSKALASQVMSGVIDVDTALKQSDDLVEASRGLYPGGQISAIKQASREAISQAAIDGAIAAKNPDRARELNARFFGGVPRPGQTQADPLTMRESGGNPRLVNSLGFAGAYQFGAPRLEALGVYTPGPKENLDTWNKTPANAPGKWSGTFNIDGFPQVKTIGDFLANPAAQKSVYDDHMEDIDQEATKAGLDKYVGQTVGGIPITQAGIRNMAHLGGSTGAAQFLKSGGAYNPADSNGTRLSDYAKMGAKAETPNVGKALTNNNRIESMDAVNRQDTTSAITDDLASMQATGKGDDTLTAERITRSLGPNATADWQTARTRAKDFYTLTQDFATLPPDQMNARILQLAPKPGQEEYVAQEALHVAAIKKADAIMALRNKDPAESVSDDPEVKTAISKLTAAPDDFLARKGVISARMAAQQRAGISVPSPLPVDETQRLLKPLIDAAQLEDAARTPKGQSNRIVLAQQQLVKDLKEKYGSYADDVMKEVIGQATNRRDRLDQAAAAGEVMAALINGTTPGEKPRVQLKTAQENNAAAAASPVQSAPTPRVSWGLGNDPAGSNVNYQDMGGGAGRGTPAGPNEPPAKTPSARSIQILMSAPASDQARLAGLFDKSFGAGSAQKYLTQKTAPTGTVTVDEGGENYKPE